MQEFMPLLYLAALLVLGAAAWGWGCLVLEMCRIGAKGRISYPTALGVAAISAVGGGLNVLSIAFPPSLWAVLVVGWVAATREFRAARLHWDKSSRARLLVPGAILLLAATFLAITVLPSGVFNPHDDFQIYFPRVAQMLQTGTLGGNPFDSIGLDTLGNQAFLQSFSLLLSGTQFLASFDAVFAALLALALVPAAARLLGCPAALLVAAMLALVLQPAQPVNTTPVYIQTAFALALLPAAADFLARRQEAALALCRDTLPIALLISAFAALKLTTTWFVALACAALFSIVWVLGGLRAAAKAAGACALVTALATAPWILLSADKYVVALRSVAAAAAGLPSSPTALLGDPQLFGGGTLLHYNVVAGFVLLAGLTGFVLFARRETLPSRSEALVASALAVASAAAYPLNAFLFDPAHALRYSLPALLAGLVLAILVCGRALQVVAGGARFPALVLSAGAPLALALGFFHVNADRFWGAVLYRSAFSFERDRMPALQFYSALFLDEDARRHHRTAQASIPQGAKLVAFVAAPHHLLYARNRVLFAYDYGLQWPWLAMPAEDAGAVREFLLASGIRYIMWQQGGIKGESSLLMQTQHPNALIRDSALRAIAARRSFTALVGTSRRLFEDDGLVVLDLGSR